MVDGFEELHRAISRLCLSPRGKPCNRISRTISIGLFPGWQEVAVDSSELLLIQNSEARRWYPWVGLEEKNTLEDDIERAVLDAYDSSLAVSLTRNKWELIDNISQVITIADMTEDGVLPNLEKSCKSVRQAMSMAGRSFDEAFRTLIVLPRTIHDRQHLNNPESPEGNSSPHHHTQGSISLRDLVSFITEEAQFDRIFILDTANQEGLILSNPRDQQYLTSYTWYFLASGPIKADHPNEYIEWYSSISAREGFVSSMGCCAVQLPVAQILEVVALRSAGDVLDQAFCQPAAKSRFKYYVNTFKNDNGLSSSESMLANFEPAEGMPLNQPADILSEHVDGDLKQVCQVYQTVREALGEFFEQDTVILNRTASSFRQNLHHEFGSHIDTILASENGSLVEAQKFADSVAELAATRLQELRSRSNVSQGDHEQALASAVESLTALADRAPKSIAIIIWALLLATSSCFLVTVLSDRIMLQIMLWISCIVVIGATSAFHIHSRKHAAARAAGNVVRALRKLWHFKTEILKHQLATQVLESILLRTETIKKDLNHCRDRIDLTVQYFKELYLPKMPTEKTVRIDIQLSRKEMLSFGDQVEVNTDDLASVFRRNSHLDQIRERLKGCTSNEPGNYERALAARSALQALDSFGGIAVQGVSKWIKRHNGIQSYARAMLLASAPYLVPDPNRIKTVCQLRGLFEGEHNQPSSELREEFDTHLQDLRFRHAVQTDRALLFQIAEGFTFQDMDVSSD